MMHWEKRIGTRKLTKECFIANDSSRDLINFEPFVNALTTSSPPPVGLWKLLSQTLLVTHRCLLMSLSSVAVQNCTRSHLLLHQFTFHIVKYKLKFGTPRNMYMFWEHTISPGSSLYLYRGISGTVFIKVWCSVKFCKLSSAVHSLEIHLHVSSPIIFPKSSRRQCSVWCTYSGNNVRGEAVLVDSNENLALQWQRGKIRGGRLTHRFPQRCSQFPQRSAQSHIEARF